MPTKKAEPPPCRFCETRPATPDNSRGKVWMGWRDLSPEETVRLLKRALREDKTGPDEGRAPKPPGARFCDTCRAEGLAVRPSGSDDETLALLLAVLYGLDPVEQLLSAMVSARSRMERKGDKNPLPGVTRLLREAEKRLRARTYLEGAKDAGKTPAQEALAAGKKPSAVRMARKRAKDRLRSK